MIADLNSNYATSNISDEKFGGVYQKVDEVYGIQQDAEDKTLGGDIEQANDETFESMTKGSYSAIRLMTGTIPLFTNITYTISDELKINPIFPKVAIISFLITLTFMLVYMIFRFTQ